MEYYHQSGEYARMHGELGRYRESTRMNGECRTFVDRLIADSFDGFRLEAGLAARAMDMFSPERVALLCAVTVRDRDWDGRISTSNKNWAASHFPLYASAGMALENCILPTHSAILDGFVNQVRAELKARGYAE